MLLFFLLLLHKWNPRRRNKKVFLNKTFPTSRSKTLFPIHLVHWLWLCLCFHCFWVQPRFRWLLECRVCFASSMVNYCRWETIIIERKQFLKTQTRQQSTTKVLFVSVSNFFATPCVYSCDSSHFYCRLRCFSMLTYFLLFCWFVNRRSPWYALGFRRLKALSLAVLCDAVSRPLPTFFFLFLGGTAGSAPSGAMSNELQFCSYWHQCTPLMKDGAMVTLEEPTVNPLTAAGWHTSRAGTVAHCHSHVVAYDMPLLFVMSGLTNSGARAANVFVVDSANRDQFADERPRVKASYTGMLFPKHDNWIAGRDIF